MIPARNEFAKSFSKEVNRRRHIMDRYFHSDFNNDKFANSLKDVCYTDEQPNGGDMDIPASPGYWRKFIL